MEHLNRKLITYCLFIAATALLVLHLLSMRWCIYLSPALFWIAITLMLGTIVYQCFKIELSPFFTKSVLLEIAVTGFALHMIYQIPTYGLRGSDAYKDMASAKGIMLSGFVMGKPQYINLTSYFPIIHILGVIISSVTGLDLLSVVKWFPSLFDAGLILLLYLLVRGIFKEEKVALLSVLMFAFLENHMLFSSVFVRETIALVLAVGCLYFYFSAKHSQNPATYYVLSIMFLIETVFAHHLTSFMLLVFLATHFIVTKMFNVSFLRRAFSGYNINGERITTSFLSLSFVAIFSYWTYVVTSPIVGLATFLIDVFTPGGYGVRSYAQMSGIIGTAIQTIRGRILLYGFYLFHAVFGLILAYGLLSKEKNRRIEAYSFTFFFFICGLGGFLSLYAVAPAAFPDRFLTFGWLLGFAPLVKTILRSKYKWLRKGYIILLIGFMLFNIYIVDPNYWDLKAVGVPTSTSKEDYALASGFNFSNSRILGFQNPLMAIYDVHNDLGAIISLLEVNLADYSWVIIQKGVLELEKENYQKPRAGAVVLENLVTNGSIGYNRIYESNNLLIFKLRK